MLEASCTDVGPASYNTDLHSTRLHYYQSLQKGISTEKREVKEF